MVQLRMDHCRQEELQLHRSRWRSPECRTEIVSVATPDALIVAIRLLIVPMQETTNIRVLRDEQPGLARLLTQIKQQTIHYITLRLEVIGIFRVRFGAQTMYLKPIGHLHREESL